MQSPYINVHIGATALHYGQSCFEGLKAFAHDDGSVYMFRPDENAKRWVSFGYVCSAQLIFTFFTHAIFLFIKYLCLYIFL